MKKLSLICLLTLASLYGFSQYSPITVSGTVKDVKGNPLVFYPVMIYADSSMGGYYFNTQLYTDSLGAFSIIIYPPAGISQGFEAYTYDCNKSIIDTFFTNSAAQINLNFIICAYVPPSCQADFYYYSDSSAYTLNFFDKSIGSPTSYFWDFGDSSSSNQQNPTHTFSKGNYMVCLTISDSATNCYNMYCTVVYIDDSTQTNKCQSYFYYNDSGLVVHFTGYSKSTNSRIIYYNWDFGDGTTDTGQNPVHIYPSAAQYMVSLNTASVDSQNDTCFSTYYDFLYLGQPQLGTIYGNISSKTYSVDKALVYLIQYNLKDSTLTVIDSTLAFDSSGTTAMYYFGSVPYGDYLVKTALTSSSLHYANCLPTYYGDVLFWNLATTLNLNNFNQFANADIVMVTGTNPGGPGFIGGKTTKGANIWELNRGTAIGNVEILLLDASGSPVSYNFSKPTGDFGFNSLALGSYQIYPEMAGKTTTPAFVTIDAQHPSINDVQIVINERSIKTSINPDISISISNVGKIYPNPVQGKLNLDINIKKSVAVDVQITNNLGQVINTINYKLTTGKNTISSDIRNLPEGIYNLNIKASDGASIFRNFSIIK